MTKLLVLLLTLLPGLAFAAPTASFTARPTQGATCVAPCAVHFDAIGEGSLSSTPWVTTETTDSEFTRPYHSLLYRWDFADDTAASCGGAGATWSADGSPRATDWGPLAAHVYCAPGSYIVSLTVKNPNGASNSTTRTVTISDPNTVFSGSIYCIGASATPTPGSSGCPSGATAVNATSVYGSADLDQALTDNSRCNADGSKKWCLFEGTFTASTSVTLFESSSPGLISSFGAGATFNWGSSTLNMKQGWTIASIAQTSTSMPVFWVNNTANNTTIYGGSLNGSQRPFWADRTANGDNYLTQVAIVDVASSYDAGCSGTDTIYFFARYPIFMGGSVTRNHCSSGNPYMIRAFHMQHFIMTHMRLYEAYQDLLQVRADDDQRIYDAEHSNRYHYIARNLFEPRYDQGGPMMKWCADSGCNCRNGLTAEPDGCGGAGGSGGIQDVGNILIENNNIRYVANGTAAAKSSIFDFEGGDITVRNNVVDYASALTNINDRFVSSLGQVVHWEGSTRSSNIHVFNNTVRSAITGYSQTYRSSENFTGNASGCTGGCLDYNNLYVWGGVSGGSVGGVNSPFSQLGAVVDTDGTDPFDGTFPSPGTATPSDYVPSSGSAPTTSARNFNSGTDTSFWVYLDALDYCRPDVSGNWDSGAVERSATACSISSTVIRPIYFRGTSGGGVKIP